MPTEIRRRQYFASLYVNFGGIRAFCSESFYFYYFINPLACMLSHGLRLVACGILRACLAWLQLCLEQLHSKTPAGASSGWSWSWLDSVFGMKGIPSSRKGNFKSALSFLPLVRGTHMSYSFSSKFIRRTPPWNFYILFNYTPPLSLLSLTGGPSQIPNPAAAASDAARTQALACRWCHMR